MPIHRALKNVIKKYTFAKSNERDVTSNDQGEQSTKLVQEFDDLTYNALALAEIMPTIWKRMDIREKK